MVYRGNFKITISYLQKKKVEKMVYTNYMEKIRKLLENIMEA